jgi:hypothetical protein
MRSGSPRESSTNADDFVICCRGTADEAMIVMRGMMSKLKLTVNETKTRLSMRSDLNGAWITDIIGLHELTASHEISMFYAWI